MNVQSIIIVCSLAWLAVAGTAQGQEVAAPTPPEENVNRALSSAPAMSALKVPPRSPDQRNDYKAIEPAKRPLLCGDKPPSVELTAGEQEQRAVLSLCFNTAAGVEINTRVSTPWEDDADNELADLDGLANAARIDLDLAWQLFGGPRSDADWIWVTSVRGAYGYEDFDVLALDLSTRSVDRDVWSAGATLALGKSFGDKGQAFIATYRREHGFANDPADEVSVCTSVISNAERCARGFLAPPDAVERSLATLEYRLAGKVLGFLIRGSYDFEDDIYGFELPVYLTRHEGKFNGGVKFGWRDDTRDFTAAVFIGAPLNL